MKFQGTDLWSMLIGWSIVAVLCLLVYLLARSPWGRVLRAVREDEDAARALGKNAYSFKMQALILGGCIGHPRWRVQRAGHPVGQPRLLLHRPDVLRLRRTDPRRCGDRVRAGVGRHAVLVPPAIPDALLRQATSGADPRWTRAVQPTGRCHPLRHPRATIPERYNARLEKILQMEKEGDACLSGPENPVKVSRAERNPAKLRVLQWRRI